MELEHCFVSSRNYAIKSKNMEVEDLNDYSLILPVKRSTPRKQLPKLLLNLVYIESNLTNIPKVFMEELKINNVKIV